MDIHIVRHNPPKIKCIETDCATSEDLSYLMAYSLAILLRSALKLALLKFFNFAYACPCSLQCRTIMELLSCLPSQNKEGILPVETERAWLTWPDKPFSGRECTPLPRR